MSPDMNRPRPLPEPRSFQRNVAVAPAVDPNDSRQGTTADGDHDNNTRHSPATCATCRASGPEPFGVRVDELRIRAEALRARAAIDAGTSPAVVVTALHARLRDAGVLARVLV